jgi:hypothetical protein
MHSSDVAQTTHKQTNGCGNSTHSLSLDGENPHGYMEKVDAREKGRVDKVASLTVNSSRF